MPEFNRSAFLSQAAAVSLDRSLIRNVIASGPGSSIVFENRVHVRRGNRFRFVAPHFPSPDEGSQIMVCGHADLRERISQAGTAPYERIAGDLKHAAIIRLGAWCTTNRLVNHMMSARLRSALSDQEFRPVRAPRYLTRNGAATSEDALVRLDAPHMTVTVRHGWYPNPEPEPDTFVRIYDRAALVEEWTQTNACTAPRGAAREIAHALDHHLGL